MITKINIKKYETLKESLYFDLSNGSEKPLKLKVKIAISEVILNFENENFFRAKISESVLNNSRYIDFFDIDSDISFNSKVSLVKKFIRDTPELLVDLFELQVV